MEKGRIHSQFVLVSYDETFESSDPTDGSFDDPSAAISGLYFGILAHVIGPILPVGGQEGDSQGFQSGPEWIAVVGLVRNEPGGTRPWASRATLRDSDFIQDSFSERNLSWRGRVDQASQRYTLTIDHHHPLRSLTPLGFADSRAPFLAGAKLPSTNASSQPNSSLWSSSERKALHISLNTSSSCHCLSRRQQVVGLGYRSGRSFHLAPERASQRIPSKTRRSSARGRPPFGRKGALGMNGSIFFHCSSVTTRSRLLIGLPPMSVIQKMSTMYKSLYQSRFHALNGFETNSSPNVILP
jgi:hypothetical protein